MVPVLAALLLAATFRVVVAADSAAPLASLERPAQRWGRSDVFSVEVTPEEYDRLLRDERVQAIDFDSPGGGALRESLAIVRADVAHASGADGSGVTIAVLDTGIDSAHPAFAGRVVAERCFCTRSNGTGCCPDGTSSQSGTGSAKDDHAHGSHVAGIIAGSGNGSPMGVAPNARIVAVKVLDNQNRFASFQQIFNGLAWIHDTQPDVRAINVSLGTDALFTGHCDDSALGYAVAPVVAALRRRGVLITVSAGNQSNLTQTPFPACLSSVMTVGATYDVRTSSAACYTPANADVDDLACFSNTSDAVDLVAPGAFITSARNGGGEVSFTGTSMAAPHVAGTIALMLQKNYALSGDTIERLLESTAHEVLDRRTSLMQRRLDVAAAVEAVPAPVRNERRRRAVR